MLARAIVIGLGLAIMYPALIYSGVISVYPPPKYTPINYSLSQATPEGKTQAEVQQKYQNDMSEFSKILLITATSFGVLAILGGALVPVPAIAAGIIAGGALSIGIGYWNQSSFLPDWWRFCSLLAGIISLSWVACRQWNDDWL